MAQWSPCYLVGKFDFRQLPFGEGAQYGFSEAHG